MEFSKLNEDRFAFLRRPVQFALDVIVLCAAFFLAYSLRVDFDINTYYFDNALNQLPFVVLVQFASLFLVGAYTILWRYISLEDVRVFIIAGAISSVFLVLVRLLLSPEQFIRWQVPLSVILMDTVLGFSGLMAVRVLRRLVHEAGDRRGDFLTKPRNRKKNALVIGAGRIGAAIVKETVGRYDTELEIVGFIDDDRTKVGSSVKGIKILGTTNELAYLVGELKVEKVVIAIDQAQGREIRRILELCQSIDIKAQIVPSLNEIAHGKIKISRLRDVEIEDLLGRDPIELDTENLNAFIGNKTVLVTGAGGSIGSELARQISEFAPTEILLLERAEFLLFQIEREFVQFFPETKIIPLIADAGDEPRIREIFEKHRPKVIFHAAAHKHVPLMEQNPGEAVKNNIIATQVLGQICGEFNVEAFVLISTDKAVNPTSIMGSSKRIAEIVIQDLNRRFKTKFVAVRFGNVLGSAGSVVPIFREQIRRGGPLTVTSKEMTRYFMTIPEASQLVLQAGAIGEGGEIFILDMGKPIKIIDLAEDMCRLSGLKPYEEIDIVETGMRGGEKLFEELEISGENISTTKHPKIFVGKIAEYDGNSVNTIISDLKSAVSAHDERKIRITIATFLPESDLTISEAKSA